MHRDMEHGGRLALRPAVDPLPLILLNFKTTEYVSPLSRLSLHRAASSSLLVG